MLTTVERSLPVNLEAERSVLGAILIHDDVFHLAAATIQPKHMFRDAHRRMFQAMWNLSDRNETIDMVTLKQELERSGDLEDCGGPAYIGSLVDGVPRATNVQAYAEIVKDHATLRQLIQTASKISERAYGAEDTAREIVAWAEQEMFDLAHGHLGSHLHDLRASVRQINDRIEFRIQHRGQVTGVDTGFDSINQLTLGWQPGDLVFVGARPSIGKTTFVMNSMVAAAKLNKQIAMFSMEMREEQLIDRLLSSLSGIPKQRIDHGALGGSDYTRLTDAMEVMHDLPLFIDDKPARTVWDIRSAAKQMKAEHGLDAVVIDYVQLMRGTLADKHATRNMELTDISNRLKALAGELMVPVIVLSQLRRASLDRPDPRPKMSDLKDCGAFEQDADIVLLLHRKNHKEGGVTHAIFEKQRNGPTGTANITLDRDVLTFTDGGEEPAPEPKPEKKPRRPR